MSTTAIDGVVAAGHWVTWIIPAATLTVEPTEGTWEIALAELNDAATVKIDCHLDFGDVNITRTPITRTRQRACQENPQNITTGETIDVTISAVFDQQAGMSDAVNDAYAAMPENADVYIAQAFGWDSSATPDATTVIDLYRGTVQSRMKNQPTTADEDLKFTATISCDARWEDVALDGGSV